MKKYLLACFVLASLTGCASVKPYILCELATSKAVVQQGISGVGFTQDLKDADLLCKLMNRLDIKSASDS